MLSSRPRLVQFWQITKQIQVHKDETVIQTESITERQKIQIERQTVRLPMDSYSATASQSAVRLSIFHTILVILSMSR